MSSFEFIPETHTYLQGDEVVPSVTQRLNDAGLVCYDHIPKEVLERKADIGTAAHAACWYLDEGCLDWESVDPAVLGYVLAWQKFMGESRFKPRLIEQRGISQMAGSSFGYTLDREGILNGFETLLEIKCTASVEPSWGPQTAAYEHALYQQDGRRRRRVAVHLKPNGSYSLKLLPDVQDYMMFRTALIRPAGWELVVKNWLELKGKSNGNDANHHS